MNLDPSEISYVQDGCLFFRNLDLEDDANLGSLIENLHEFNSEDYETDINQIINMFHRFLTVSKVRKVAEKELAKKH